MTTLNRSTLQWCISRLENKPKCKMAAHQLRSDLMHIELHNRLLAAGKSIKKAKKEGHFETAAFFFLALVLIFGAWVVS